MTTLTPTGDNTLLTDAVSMRKIGWLERTLGPENFRIMQGLLKTPASIVGFILIILFVLIAVFAPVIAPPAGRDPYQIPRDGFKAEPQPMGAEWRVRPPPLPFWWEPIMGTDKWVHIFGTSQGQYDLFYGIIWGTRTAFKTGMIVVIATFVIGVVIGSISAYYGGLVDNIIMRIVDIFLTLPFILAALILAAVITPRFGRSLIPAILALVTFGWMGYARVIRGDILSTKERDYVMAAKVIGVKDSRIRSSLRWCSPPWPSGMWSLASRPFPSWALAPTLDMLIGVRFCPSRVTGLSALTNTGILLSGRASHWCSSSWVGI
jgi:peptide/nickel transport system permease protein